MSTIIDTKGFSCPQPVLMFMEAAKNNDPELVVLTDTETSKENVSRAAENKGYTIEQIEQIEDEYRLTLKKEG